MSDRHPVFVVGYDASPPANAALAHAAALGHGGRIVVVHAHEPAPKQLDERWRAVLAADQEARSQAVLDGLPEDIAARLSDIAWETMSVDGPPCPALCRVAAEQDADAIVIGTHGYGRLGAMLGSVAHALLREADRPVVVIPPRAVERVGAAAQ
ncbi:MAG: universal stress protein [Solirubrobacteraceae bacterium]|nr:universal stress protein [Solirubrobacteraceae bacterium]